MGKKLLIASVLIVTILFGLIFWKVNKADQVVHKPVVKNIHRNSPVLQLDVDAKKVIVSHTAEVEQDKTEEKNASQGSAQTLEQIAPAAFGFLQQQEVLQVVGFLSNHDKNGSLMAYIDGLCQKRTCDIDVAYRNDIIDAKWQDDIVSILKLFTTEEIEDGSLFIQADSIKLEGKVVDVKSALELQKYLSNVKDEGLKKQNLTGLNAVAKNQKTDGQETKQNSLSKKANKVVEINSTVKTHIETETLKTGARTKEMAPAKNVSHTKISVKKIKKSPSQKHRVKKLHTVRRKPQQDIIAPSYMETSIDLEKKIKSRKKQGQKYSDSLTEEEQGMVADPRFEILH